MKSAQKPTPPFCCFLLPWSLEGTAASLGFGFPVCKLAGGEDGAEDHDDANCFPPLAFYGTGTPRPSHRRPFRVLTVTRAAA